MAFKPSGIAIHPNSRDVYVISSAAKCLIVLNDKGDLKSAHHLPRSIFRQPEGITFDDDLNLYISNEGQDKKANLLKFTHHPCVQQR